MININKVYLSKLNNLQAHFTQQGKSQRAEVPKEAEHKSDFDGISETK
jgi:hypothetical protein